MANGMTRRQLLMAGAVAGVAGQASRADAALHTRSKRGRALRFAHLTDVHVQPELAGGEGFAACLHHVQNQKDAPELLVFGGDNVMNVDSEDGAARADVQLNLWNSVLKSECSLPHKVAIGNHDILHNHPVDGKQWAVDAYGLPGRCYVYDQAGWRFIFLDGVMPQVTGYIGKLDDAQFEWLGDRLKEAGNTPVCIVSHIPILAVCTYLCLKEPPQGDWQTPASWMHVDAHRIKDLFNKHKNVKLCLSGHMHMADSLTYLGTTYTCNGAVSGGWWKGAYFEFDPGYALVDLYDDGEVAVEFVNYGWTAKA
ncbi:MAG: hypothetical protein AMXMBFR84_28010 [Candidatus Hydrogenedentota bacterium]